MASTSGNEMNTAERKPRPDFYNVTDIDGASSHARCFRTNRVVNPLEPVYKLPAYEEAPYEVPKFVRDSFNVSDIEGTKPREKKYMEARNSYDVSDIDGTSSSWKSPSTEKLYNMRRQCKDQKKDFYDVSDICDRGFKTKRCTNPLQPEYYIHGSHHSDELRNAFRNENKKNSPFYSLETSDIKGAQGGSSSAFEKLRMSKRKQFHKNTDVSDIPGAQPNMLRLTLKTNRATDPLQPKYTYLHGFDTPTPPSTGSRERRMAEAMNQQNHGSSSDRKLDISKLANSGRDARQSTTRTSKSSDTSRVNGQSSRSTSRSKPKTSSRPATSAEVQMVRDLPQF